MSTTYTYDLSTDIGQVREFLADTDLDNAVWSDEQITYYLSLANNKVSYTDDATLGQIYLACAFGLETSANRLAYLATKQKIAIFQEDTVVTYQSVMTQATHFRKLSAMEGGILVSTPDNFYTIVADTTNPYDPDDSTKVQPISSLDVW